MKKKELVTDLVFHILIVLSTVIAVVLFFYSGPDALGSTGVGCFKYFTTDSNVMMALASLVCIFFETGMLRDPGKKMPGWVLTLRFAGTVSVAVTLLTVVFFLAPVSCMQGGIRNFLFFFEGNTFALHLSTPLLAIVSFLFFSGKEKISFVKSLWNLTPTVVYSVVYLIFVVFVRIWYDWYGFTFGGHNELAPVSMLAMYLVTLGISEALRRIRARIAKKKEN